jgi:hypothetical protein
MTFSIPNSLKSVNSLLTSGVIEVELNDIDIDRMMSQLLELAVKNGRRSTSRTVAKDYLRYLQALQQNPHLEGFQGSEGQALLDGWLRASVLKMEKGGLAREFSQMGYLRPVSIAVYRSGLPKAASRHRKADTLTYRVMERHLQAAGMTGVEKHIRKLFEDTFGAGVDLGESPWASPTYDGKTAVDIDTLLALRFLEAFTGSENLSRDRAPLDPPVPEAVDPIGKDLVEYLTLFGPVVPVAEAYSHVSALLSLRLFQLPLVTARALRAALAGNWIQPGNPCDLYCDFVRQRGTSSDELSRLCVQRDLEIFRSFFGDRLLLRSLADAAEMLPKKPELGSSAQERLQLLASLRNDATVGMALTMRILEISNALGDSDEEGRDFIAAIRESDLTPSEQLTMVLVEGLRKRGLENQVKWFWSTGGIVKPYGILAGTRSARSTWRYAPSDEALTALLSMCFIEHSGNRTSRRLPIREVLKRLRERFGILVDTPPAEFDSADSRAGASQNLSAFTRRLQLIGCFQGLSDDFSAQFVTRPREAVQ